MKKITKAGLEYVTTKKKMEREKKEERRLHSLNDVDYL